MIKTAFAIATLAMVAQHGVASARNIVLTNDDGLTSNVLALYRALKADGHDVIVSVPCQNQSGMGAAIIVGRPLTPLTQACLAGAAEAGAPAAGPMTRKDLPADDFFYVDGTPVMSMLYGVDVIGQQRWGKEPDLFLSGPNEGQNVGAIVLSSGTVSNAQYAAVRGIPAIALSAGARTVDDVGLDHPDSAKVAELSADLVAALADRAGEGSLLPADIALNVNFPDKLDGAEWLLSRIGTYNAYDMRFSADMAASATPVMKAMAAERGIKIPSLPGLSFGMNSLDPTTEQGADESVVYRSAIAVSAMQAGYAADDTAESLITERLAGFLTVPSE
ncbi:5'/3'-nucleotidase SurE [Novosphingobium sp. BW1]|uniref:5'/3'-nucleotidase SurE n=1 Tax=Novosphingobium sp. BW1 TaxID=2592621 RepID=UPI0011DEE0AF|nr:5'/3'-nucleotidase SurE [Novosphingobium sp. BW1]TYC94358.1 acid phosphatase [Novosphingobium sp. BW1]